MTDSNEDFMNGAQWALKQVSELIQHLEAGIDVAGAETFVRLVENA